MPGIVRQFDRLGDPGEANVGPKDLPHATAAAEEMTLDRPQRNGQTPGDLLDRNASAMEQLDDLSLTGGECLESPVDGRGDLRTTLLPLGKIGDLAETRPDDFKAQELANVAWSFATADLDAPRLYASLATSATPRLAQFSAQEVANVCDPRGKG